MACATFGDAADRFRGNGLLAQGVTVGGRLEWQKVNANRSTTLDLTRASVTALNDDEKSWPEAGNLLIDGFTYTGFQYIEPDRIDECTSKLSELVIPSDASTRLKWLALYRPPTFKPQPYEQLARVLKSNGDDGGAARVLIAMENARYSDLSLWERWWGWVLWASIGYGYEPWRALWFIAGFVAIGSLLFRSGYRGGWMVLSDAKDSEHAKPFNSFIYSLETFLPLVDLHQADHWVPNAEARKSNVSPPFGKYLRWYL